MDAYDPTELLRLCDSVLEDGELSGKEIYALADWLNRHREACFHWPGNTLVQPLQEVWADGHVSKAEMRQIGRLLVRIRKEWTRRQSGLDAAEAQRLADQMCRNFEPRRAAAPGVPFVTRIPSPSQPDVLYDVDLRAPACTCPEWRAQRQSLSPGHLSRCCQHVLQAYGILEPPAGWPGWFGPFVESGSPPDPCAEWMVLDIAGQAVLAATAPEAWAEVYAPAGGAYDRFAYHVREQRWSYGLEPEGAAEIARAIRQASPH